MSRFLTQRTSPSYVYDTCSNIRTEREAEDKRLEETFSSQLAIDDGVDAYEDVGSGEVYSEADEVKGESAGDKNQRYSWMQITTITMTAGTVTSMAMQVGRAREQRARIPYTPSQSAAIRRHSPPLLLFAAGRMSQPNNAFPFPLRPRRLPSLILK